MASLVGQSFPEDVSFMYVPYTPEKSDLNACGLPIKYDASKGMLHAQSIRQFTSK